VTLFRDLDGNQLINYVPVCSALPNLVYLDLSATQATQDLSFFAGCGRLEYLDISSNFFTGVIDLSQMPSLQYLYFSNNNFGSSDTSPDFTKSWNFAPVPGLLEFNISGSGYSGEVSPDTDIIVLGSLQSLYGLSACFLNH
jgi:Leucine-rich repeat (LRR) protein